ncbi:hypothetical protein CLV24_11145 [Pontibacter ummariensis]|uniref:Uncharacterized protein n=1 Tax=Pontibacter ummariensis TaxID=1610492 RepID=A0A239GG60_9BACT|nr:hypothetical protein [Pontibacter ummariensis]PRY11250.1 hypothetical protein CLV24_11145 [Pontibacter ummariensis]SNS68119.1 hypothetical protein SAMN06296052_11145 [Pontibacter ummariensis]
MEYNIIIAPSLEALASEVASFLPMGWKLKDGIVEHVDGFAQQLIRYPKDSMRMKQQKPKQQEKPQRRMKWIE